MYGWHGKLLRVNLSRRTTSWEEIPPAVLKDYVGARGLGIRYLLDEVDPACDPLGPENKLIFSTGPLTGTRAPTGARYIVTTKSPLTGVLTCANSGGFFPAELRRTGVDAIVFEGCSDEPVYLWLSDGRAELRPARDLWGKTTHETTDALVAAHGPGTRVACIGPAGENRVRFASIMNDKDRAAGRSGVGAVMGAKNLKAVAVRGTTPVRLHDEEAFRSAVKRYLDRFHETYRDEPPPLRSYGTAVTVMGTQNVGVFPTRNFQTGQFEQWEALHGETLTQRFLVKPKACFSCPIACGRVTRVDEPGYEGEGEGPEYETVYSLGSDCGVADLAAVTKANYLCNELGLDTISMGATIACAMEMFEKGILTEAAVGMELRFGNARALVELTRMTAHREGFGDLLAEGSLRLATRFGHPELAVTARGQEFPGYDPRGEQGMGLAYATSPIGASHMRGDPAYIEILGVPTLIDPLEWKGKGELVAEWQNTFALIDAAGLCVFFTIRNLVTPDRHVRPTGILELLNAATGAGYTLEELERAGERIFNAERLFMIRAGSGGKDDTLPPRMLREPMPDGPAKGMVVHLSEMLEEYYRFRGWDAEGNPTPEKLRELGLG
ncbi:aldehyde ferredoxin oxidoreductase family protein [Deferrisoma camini]|uniref:aldehyde ferredoxin oxidoreductase family protein n=1 Tax=Deferrisoma camini TaxID=1035120 RepID=UPI00046D180D|nr:aldehyde ferredoxin oxidoreductase family protein [Deferrisoma camini]